MYLRRRIQRQTGDAPLYIYPCTIFTLFNLIFFSLESTLFYFCLCSFYFWVRYGFFDDGLRTTFADGKVENLVSLALPPAVLTI